MNGAGIGYIISLCCDLCLLHKAYVAAAASLPADATSIALLEAKRYDSADGSSPVCSAHADCNSPIDAVIVYPAVRSIWEISATPALPLTDRGFVLHVVVSYQLSRLFAVRRCCSSFYAYSHRHLLIMVRRTLRLT